MTLKAKALVFALALLVALAFVADSRAQNTNTTVDVVGLSAPIILSVDGVVAVCSNADVSGYGSKRVAIIGAEVAGGVPVHLMVRIQRATNGLFIDVVTASTLAQLDTNVGSMDFSGRSHPSPTEDAVDTAALLDAAN